MSGLVDYAGLFPPARLPMREAVRNYQEYSRGGDSYALAAFILPAERFDEFEDAALGGANQRTAPPWRVNVLVKEELTAALNRIDRFDSVQRQRRNPIARVDGIELPYGMLSGATSAEKSVFPQYHIYVEVSEADDVARVIPQLRAAGSRAKLRTGGVTAAAIPATQRVLRFLRECCTCGVAFKATAGLHHPVRAEYPLTYEQGSERTTMFGFLNVFLAAAFIWNGADDATAAMILEESATSAFEFRDSAIVWRDREMSVDRLTEARRAFAISFGSCSFREPVDELKQLLGRAARS